MKLTDRIKLHWHACRDAFSQAECYEHGRYVDQDLEQAWVLYQTAMQQGDARAYFRFAQRYQENLDENKAIETYYEGAVKNHALSKQVLLEMAEQGNLTAIIWLGNLFSTLSEWEQAIAWYGKAAHQSNPDAMYRLGQIYSSDDSPFQQDMPKALMWFKEAARQGSKYGLNELVVFSNTHGVAAFYLAELYLQGEGGVHPNQTKARQFYEKAAELGDAQANFILGQLYEKGSPEYKQDTSKAYMYFAHAARNSHAEAKSYLERMAHAGDAAAQYALGYEYYRTLGNIREATQWCVHAEMLDHPLAMRYLSETTFDGYIYLKIARLYQSDQTNPYRNMKRFLEFYAKAASVSDCSLAANIAQQLAQFYQTNHGSIKKDLTKAFDLYLLAAKSGNKEALPPLECLAEDMSANKQLELSQLYEIFFNNLNKATYWHDKAKEVEGLKLSYIKKK